MCKNKCSDKWIRELSETIKFIYPNKTVTYMQYTVIKQLIKNLNN